MTNTFCVVNFFSVIAGRGPSYADSGGAENCAPEINC